MAILLDANVLIALVIANHTHHDAAETWFTESADKFATCPITEGSLVRMIIRESQSTQSAQAVIAAIAEDSRHEFWADDLPYCDTSFNGVIGHRQVTDAYLAQLARSHNGRVASFDQGLAKLHHDIVDLVST